MASTMDSSPNNSLGVPFFPLANFLRTSDERTETTTTTTDNAKVQTRYSDA